MTPASGRGQRAHRIPARLARRSDPTVRLQDFRRNDAERAGGGLEVGEVARHDRSQRGIENRGAETLVLAKLRQHLVRCAHEGFREGESHRCGDARLVRGIAIGVQEADGHGFHPLAAELLDHRPDRGLLRRHVIASEQVGALLDLAAQTAWNGWRRFRDADVVVVGLALAADLENVAHAVAGNQRGPGRLADDQRIRRDRGAMAEVGHRVGRDAGLLEEVGDAACDRFRWILRRRWRLVTERGAVRKTHQREVRERTADVDPQRESLCGHRQASVAPRVARSARVRPSCTTPSTTTTP